MAVINMNRISWKCILRNGNFEKMHHWSWYYFWILKEDRLMTKKIMQDCIRRQFFALSHFVKSLSKRNDLSSNMINLTWLIYLKMWSKFSMDTFNWTLIPFLNSWQSMVLIQLALKDVFLCVFVCVVWRQDWIWWRRL